MRKKALIKEVRFENTTADRAWHRKQLYPDSLRDIILWEKSIHDQYKFPLKISWHQLDRDLFPESLGFNTKNSSAVKHPSQNFLNCLSLPKTLLGFSVVLLFSQDCSFLTPVIPFSGVESETMPGLLFHNTHVMAGRQKWGVLVGKKNVGMEGVRAIWFLVSGIMPGGSHAEVQLNGPSA